MSLGKIHCLPDNPRTYKALIAAKYSGVSLEEAKGTLGQTNKSADFLAKFPFGRFPSAETKEGPLFESNAIAYYVAAQRPELVGGSSAYAAAVINQFMAVADNEVVPHVSAWLYPILGYMPYDEAANKKAQENCHKALQTLDTILLTRTYLVGEQITLADIVMWCTVLGLYRMVLDAPARAKYVSLTRWFVTLANQPNFKAVLSVTLCDKPAVYDAKKTVAAAAAPKAAADNDDEEEKPVEKAKNPLDLLPPSTLNLEDWKRFYSNNETRPTAINWFWEKYDPQGYSIWRIDYKYNEELSKIFMTCNLVSGLFQRMDRLRKYTFGTVLITGTDNNNQISGYLVFRGQGIPPEMTEVADFDSYTFRRVDTNDKKERALFEDYLAWDGELGGLKLAEGKTFK